jgi:hypothetical protein
MARSEAWLLILLVVGFILLSARWHRASPATGRAQLNAKPTPRPLKPRTPDDCRVCRSALRGLLPASTPPKPYSYVKGPRGRKKRMATFGFACPNPDCQYYGITDDQIHALVADGTHTCTGAARQRGASVANANPSRTCCLGPAATSSPRGGIPSCIA